MPNPLIQRLPLSRKKRQTKSTTNNQNKLQKQRKSNKNKKYLGQRDHKKTANKRLRDFSQNLPFKVAFLKTVSGNSLALLVE